MRYEIDKDVMLNGVRELMKATINTLESLSNKEGPSLLREAYVHQRDAYCLNLTNHERERIITEFDPVFEKIEWDAQKEIKVAKED